MHACLSKTVYICLSFCVAIGARGSELLPARPAQGREADDARRQLIEKELDQNQATVKQLYAYLDQVPEADAESRRELESQVEQYDDRNAVLYDELEELDRRRYLRGRRRDMELQIQRLTEEAAQLRRAGRPLAAAAREAKARELRKRIDDGTWQLDVADEWSCEVEPQAAQELVKLRREFELLQQESRLVQQEVKRLRAIVEQLKKAVEGS
jgi:hypothetical protein